MAHEPRVVIDTNVAISAALLPHSTPRQALDLTLKVGRMLISQSTLVELDEVLRRPKFEKYLSEDHRQEFLAALVREAEIVEINETITDCRDPKDNKFLELGVCGQASHLMTGDADLLVLHPFRSIAILTPQAFLESAGAAGASTP
jgi:putative PIN family toxin of toxin-antitoxin system